MVVRGARVSGILSIPFVVPISFSLKLSLCCSYLSLLSFLGCDLDPGQGVKQFKFESWDPVEGLSSYLVFVHPAVVGDS